MLFNSEEFLVFLPVVALVFFVIPKRFQYLWLLAASYFFYMCWNAQYALLILASTAITYLCALILAGTEGERRRKWVLAFGIAANLGILFYFKYSNFGIGLLEKVLERIHIRLNVPEIDVILPVGISFYTFQALGYVIDVYRGEIPPERNFFRYALFVSFFPQLVAGPIERSGRLLGQLEETRSFSMEDFRNGLLMMIWGYFLKIVIADRVAVFVDTVYLDYQAFGGWYLTVATVLFAVQIYCDFYGYSAIAMGTARILGIRLMENFDAPYLSESVSEFWKRWHISLTSWFRDYLYIPLGGNRKGTFRKNINKMIVFLASGLWHGASLSFVFWGFLNGCYQVIGEGLRPVRDRVTGLLRLNRDTIGHRLLRTAVTFLLIDFSWVFFRASRLKDAFQILHSMAFDRNPWILFDGSLYSCGLDGKNFTVMLVSIGILLFAGVLKYRRVPVRTIILSQDYWFRWLFIAVSIWLILVFGIWGPAYDTASFIYFQF